MEHLTCTACELHRGRTRVVPGQGPKGARLALVGESPGREEDESGIPFVGMAGKLLNSYLVDAGLCRAVSVASSNYCIRHDVQALSMLDMHGVEMLQKNLCNTHEGILSQVEPVSPSRGGKVKALEEQPLPDASIQLSISTGAGSLGVSVRKGVPPTSDGRTQSEGNQAPLPLLGDNSSQQSSHSSSYKDSDRSLKSHQHRSIPQDKEVKSSCYYCTIRRQLCQPIWITNLVSCRPPANNLQAYPNAILTCPPLWLDEEIKDFSVIVTLGGQAGNYWLPGKAVSELETLCRVLPSGQVVVGAMHPAARGDKEEKRRSIVRSLRRAKEYT